MSTDEFEPRTIDKVERLFDLLDEMERHPALKGKLALHGGTAINLFMLNVPRLSVDIDVSYIGCVSRDGIIADRPRIGEGIENVARALGYAVETHSSGHAGRTFLLRYRGDWGVDHVKVDCIYMNRSPILPPAVRGTPVRSDAKVRTFADAELAAGFPKPFEGGGGTLRTGLPNSQTNSTPCSAPQASTQTFDVLMEDAERFIAEWVLPGTDRACEYLDRLADGDYLPELVFPDEAIARAATVNPEALRKVESLRKIPR